MFGIGRKGVAVAVRRTDRQRRGHFVRSLRSRAGLLEQVKYSKSGGAEAFGLQRLLEGLSGSYTTQDRDRYESPRSSRLASSSLSFDRNVEEKLSGNESTPWEALRRGVVSHERTLYPCWSSADRFPMASHSHLLDPLQSMLGMPSSPSSDMKYYHNYSGGSRRYLSTEKTPPRSQSQYKTSVKIPTPHSNPNTSLSPFANFDPQALLKGFLETAWSLTKMILMFSVKLPVNVIFYATHGNDRREKIQEIKDIARKEFDHYWTGTKLLMAEVRTARDLVRRTLSGSTLTRRERKQLLRTISDLIRVVPFSMFLIIPAAEFALPFALRIFPNMLPSTFQDSLKAEENMKRELQSRIAMAQFFQETLGELAKEQKRIATKRIDESPDNEIANKQEQSAESMLQFLDRAREGEMMPPEVIVRYAKYFQDDLTLDNMPRMQLVNMCRYMQLQPYGAESFLRFQLRHRIRTLKEDDQRIIWEGINSLTKMELREACQERGMRSTGLSKEAYKNSLQQWLDLSVHKNVPISLLIMSRTFFLQEEMTTPVSGSDEAKSVASLADAISGMDKEVLNEVILEVATSEEKKSNPDIRRIKLEVVTQQNEMIREEREAAEKKKKSSEKTELPALEETVATFELDLPLEQAELLTEIVDAQNLKSGATVLKTREITGSVDSSKESVESHSEEEHDHELSTYELDAISQLLTADPVSKEREELARIKSAMQESEDDMDTMEEGDHGIGRPEFLSKVEEARKVAVDSSTEPDDKTAASVVAQMEKAAGDEADRSTVFSTESELPAPANISELVEAGSEVEEVDEDPVIARLKRRVESMVNKIELQLSDVEVKIGDKLHILDKDLDGVMSREEMATCLQQVLKREITHDEAMEIAGTMDENADGVFTAQELIKWIETNKLVQLESEGRDADMDRIMESHASESSKDETAESVGQESTGK